MERTKKSAVPDIGVLQYIKITYRTILFIAVLVIYILNRVHNTGKSFSGTGQYVLLGGIWLLFMVEMAFRLFPSKCETAGSQKHFARNYNGEVNKHEKVKLGSAKPAVAIAVLWIALTAAIGILYYTKIIDDGVLLLISLLYSVCDIVCILFFCPFQSWFMKNKCCTTCRIYNWDYTMMFSPLVFAGSIYGWTLLGMALLILAKWEFTVWRHPERFSEQSNKSISCARCQDHLCQHKKQFQACFKKGRVAIEDNAAYKSENRSL